MTLRDLAERLHCRLEGGGDIDIVRVAALDGRAAGRRHVPVESQVPRAGRSHPGDGHHRRRHAHRRAVRHLAVAAPLPDVRAGAGVADPGRPPGPRRAPLGRGRRGRDHRSRRIGGRLRLCWGVCEHWSSHGRASLRVHRSGRAHRRRLRDPLARGDPRGRDAGRPRHPAERRRDWRRRLWVRDHGPWHAEKIPQIGVVVIEDDVEIGANTAIDRPPLGETRIGAGHENRQPRAGGARRAGGRHVCWRRRSGIAGTTTVGDHVVLGGQVGVAGHITVGERHAGDGANGHSERFDAGRRSCRATRRSTTGTG